MAESFAAFRSTLESLARERQRPVQAARSEVLELSLREALGLGHNYVGTEHILLGLICRAGGPLVVWCTGFSVGAPS